MADLKPCPFCGSGDVAIARQDDIYARIACRGCKIGKSWCMADDDEIIAAWNQRAGWRDIATAPKDGTVILQSDGRNVWASCWTQSMGWWSIHGKVDGKIYGKTTLWQPLPEPPVVASCETTEPVTNPYKFPEPPKEGGANGK